jgi:hypothetical protein
MKAYGGVALLLHLSINCALHGGKKKGGQLKRIITKYERKAFLEKKQTDE